MSPSDAPVLKHDPILSDRCALLVERGLLIVLIPGALVMPLACARTEVTHGSERSVPAIELLVTGAAAEALTASGQFETVHTPTPGGPPEISETEARRLAKAWVRDYAPSFKPFLKEGHGAVVQVEVLEPCGRAYYAATPYEPLSTDIPLPTRRAYGPWWLVTLCSPAGALQVLLAVSAYNVDLLDEDGQHKYAFHAGNEYRTTPIPEGDLSRLLSTPEEAVRMVAQATGRLIRQPPVLISGASGPRWSRWRVALDSAVTVRRARLGDSLRTDVIFVGPVYDQEFPSFTHSRPAIAVPSTDQPDDIAFTYVSQVHPSAPRDQRLVEAVGRLKRRPSMPLRFQLTLEQATNGDQP